MHLRPGRDQRWLHRRTLRELQTLAHSRQYPHDGYRWQGHHRRRRRRRARRHRHRLLHFFRVHSTHFKRPQDRRAELALRVVIPAEILREEICRSAFEPPPD